MQIRAHANDNQVINVSSQARERAALREGKGAQGKQGRANIYAGDLGMQNDYITQRIQRARKKALKMIGDVWEGDRKVDQSIADMKEKAAALQDEIRANNDIIAEGDEKKEALRQQYGVEMDSQEQKDLELLQKRQDSLRSMTDVRLTEEEQERLAQLDKEPLTEYQQRCLDIDKYQSTYEGKNDKLNAQMRGYYASITATRLERLKYHEMEKAQTKADEVMEAAGKEALGLLISEGKDHMDEELEEKVEDAKEKAEEKAEKEEKIEERQEDREALEERIDEAHEKREAQEEQRRESEERAREDGDLLDAMIDAGMGGVSATSDVQSDIKNMLHKMKLLEEDIKGSTVDDQL